MSLRRGVTLRRSRMEYAAQCKEAAVLPPHRESCGVLAQSASRSHRRTRRSKGLRRKLAYDAVKLEAVRLVVAARDPGVGDYDSDRCRALSLPNVVRLLALPGPECFGDLAGRSSRGIWCCRRTVREAHHDEAEAWAASDDKPVKLTIELPAALFRDSKS